MRGKVSLHSCTLESRGISPSTPPQAPYGAKALITKSTSGLKHRRNFVERILHLVLFKSDNSNKVLSNTLKYISKN